MIKIPLLVVSVSLLLTGCSSTQQLADRGLMLKQVASVYGTPAVPIAGLAPSTSDKASRLRIYIEGDGRAYATARQPSTDPTPIGDTTHQLMALDAGRAGYLARPCQFLSGSHCTLDRWTTYRFGQSNIDAMSAAVDDMKARENAAEVELVGYSGGAAVALLLAAQRKDVYQVQTIAGTLDHEAWTSALKLSPLNGSLNPTAFADRLASIPQRHYVGDQDTVMPDAVVISYMRKVRPQCAEVISVNATHEKGFEGAWSRFKDREVTCQDKR